ncbi:transcriptional regulator [Cohnella abietis]|uniref:Transcriptional regulator n=2 Tax=Cohnella abietis TaxID=2507935 RepID=A0A3T1D3Q4_9BACL|nr:transcriptional regulator [Cohnella abietis]
MLKKAEGFDSEKIIVLPPYLVSEMLTHPLIRPLYITDIGYFPHANHHYRERPDGCDSSIVIYCIGGEGWVTIGDIKYSLLEGDLVIIPAKTPHSYGADEVNPWSIFWFHLKGEMMVYYLEELVNDHGPLNLSHGDAEKFINLFHQIYDTLTAKSYSIPHLVHVSQTTAYMLSLLVLIPARKDEERKRRHIENAMQYLVEKLEHTLTLEELAHHARISKQHLNVLFKSATGFAPIDYYHRMKMRRACQLLDLTDLSVKETCHSLGFKDPYYFSRLFKKIIGLSPSAYRSKLKG